jgi:hypothetical protein
VARGPNALYLRPRLVEKSVRLVAGIGCFL